MNQKNKVSVTQILSQIYPMQPGVFEEALSFEKLSVKIEKGELDINGIAYRAKALDVGNVMNMLTSLGTLVHGAAYDLGILGFTGDYADSVASPFIDGLKKFFHDYNVVAIHPEAAFECEEYRGSTDGIYQVTIPDTGDIEVWLLDWKTWGLYKHIYGIEPGKPTVKSSDKKKVSVQLSMYQYMFDPLFEGKYLYRGVTYPIHKRVAIWIRPGDYTIVDCKNEFNVYLEWKKFRPNTSITL